MATRRQILTTLAAAPLALSPLVARAEAVIELGWRDLIPEGDGGTVLQSLRDLGVVEHGQLSTGFEQPDWDSVCRGGLQPTRRHHQLHRIRVGERPWTVPGSIGCSDRGRS